MILENKKNNHSLYLYTALIFIVAILVIILAYFTRKNLENQHKEYLGTQAIATTIAERSAQLSEENRILLQTTQTLNDANKELNNALELATKQLDNNDDLCIIMNCIINNDINNAAHLFAQLDKTSFTDAQNEFYLYLQSEILKRYKK